MANHRTLATQYANEHRSESRAALEQFIRIPSVSADPAHQQDVLSAAEWLVGALEDAGVPRTRIVATSGHPLVWGEIPAGENSGTTPVLLIYGHYDVQPPDPLELWESDPFAPTERGGRLYGRGASDMKAQVMATVCALQAVTATGELPVTVRFLLEGEEEIGSPSLAAALSANAELFAADVCLNLDSGMHAPDTPTITYGLRGLGYFQINLRGPGRDLHSGAFGGAVANPAQILAELVAGMHDADGRVTLPGFYDRVWEISAEERDRLARLPLTEERILRLSGAPAVWGDSRFSVAERIAARPTLEINGIWGGYTGPGAKTVIPAEAHAKISCRLVPDQRPEEVSEQLHAYMDSCALKTVTWEIQEMAGGAPYYSSPETPAHQAFSRALQAVWGRNPLLSRHGGSVPVTSHLEQILQVPSILSGFALPEDQIHSPNESQDIENWYRGISTVTHFLFELAATG